MLRGQAAEELGKLTTILSKPTPLPRPIKQSRLELRVVAGDILRVPVDRVAARVVAKAPDICKPPPVKFTPPPKNKKGKMKPEVDRIPSQATPIEEYRHAMIAQGSPEYNRMLEEIAGKVLTDLLKLVPEETRNLAAHFLSARESLEQNLRACNVMRDEFAAAVKVFLNDVRTTRMAVVTETSSMIQPLKDIRQFFLGPDYETQLKRLGEFVDLCERLMRLKEAGFLDKIADTMLRLDT